MIDFLRTSAAKGNQPTLSSCARSWSPGISTERKEDLEALHDLLEAGKVSPVVDRTFPLSEVPEAIRYLRDGRAHGKVVITVLGADHAAAPLRIRASAV